MKLWIEKWVKSCTSKERDEIEGAWARCDAFLRGFKQPNGTPRFVIPGPFEFMVSPEGFGYESFMYKPGDIVKTTNEPEPRIGVVEKYCRAESGGWGLAVTFADGVDKLRPIEVALMPIPKEIMDVARRRLSAKCPLMKEECDE